MGKHLPDEVLSTTKKKIAYALVLLNTTSHHALDRIFTVFCDALNFVVYHDDLLFTFESEPCGRIQRVLYLRHSIQPLPGTEFNRRITGLIDRHRGNEMFE